MGISVLSSFFVGVFEGEELEVAWDIYATDHDSEVVLGVRIGSS
jgi:hypothetical protein